MAFFRSTLRQSQPNKAGLKCLFVRSYVRTYVRPSTKSFFDFNEIWHVHGCTSCSVASDMLSEYLLQLMTIDMI